MALHSTRRAGLLTALLLPYRTQQGYLRRPYTYPYTPHAGALTALLLPEVAWAHMESLHGHFAMPAERALARFWLVFRLWHAYTGSIAGAYLGRVPLVARHSYSGTALLHSQFQ